MAKLANIYAPFEQNTVFRFQYDTESLTAFRVRVYATQYVPSSGTEKQIGEVPGEAVGQVMSIPVFTSDMVADSIHTLGIKKVASNGTETTLTLDRSYELKITPEVV